MFVSIAVDPGSEERAKELAELLIQYGFEKIQRGLWESTTVSQETLARVKRDLDQATDAFDRLRIFQFPVDGTLVLSTLRDNKWRRLIAKGGETAVTATPAKRPTGSQPAAPPRPPAQPRPVAAPRPAVPPQRAAQPRPAQPRPAAPSVQVRHGRRATDL